MGELFSNIITTSIIVAFIWLGINTVCQILKGKKKRDLKRLLGAASSSSSKGYTARLDKEKVCEHLSTAITYQTVNRGSGNIDRDAIKRLHSFLKETFPTVHSSLLVKKEVINEYSLLYYVKGTDDGMKPYMLCGHMDVVPVSELEWDVPPFSGLMRDGWIWGRGTIDCKDLVMGILEALECLLCAGYAPRRSFYIAFGHDEESGGKEGALEISKVLKERNVQLEYVLDEGTFVMDNIMPGVNDPIALVSVSEKGSLNLELSIRGIPGHSSAPPKETVIVILSKALAKLKGNIFPPTFQDGTEKQFFETIAIYAKFPYNIIYSNPWFFKDYIHRKIEKTPLAAILRTTTAVTVVSGGTKVNVIPSSAFGQVNHRVHRSQNISEVFDFVKQKINDTRIEIKKLSEFAPHPVSPIDNFAYKIIETSIREVIGDCCVAPFTNLANTDTRWYLDLSKAIYRFSIVHMKPAEVSRFHGNNEKISEDNYMQVVRFYIHLIQQSDK